MRDIIISKILEYTCQGEYLFSDYGVEDISELDFMTDNELIDLFEEIVGFSG